MEQRICQCEECKQNPDGPTYKKRRQLNYLMSILDEKQRRILATYEAEQLGLGGDTKIKMITGLDYKTIQKGKNELYEEQNTDYIRVPGAGRPSIKRNEEFLKNIAEIISENKAGNPMSDQIWTDKSSTSIKQSLFSRGIDVCLNTVIGGLDSLGFSLHANTKILAGKENSLKEGQFKYINLIKNAFLESGDPVLSIDTKKKELIGNFKHNGTVYSKLPIQVLDHDFPSLAEGRIVPYGIYDINMNQAIMYVGIFHDTAEFAVEGIVVWWQRLGKCFYPGSERILLLSGGGGSNSSRSNLWKYEIQKQIIKTLGLIVMVCHYPPYTSKWNKIEHAVFSFISHRWAGKPLYTLETVLFYLSSTRTQKGLRIYPVLTTKDYETGKKLTDEEISRLNFKMHSSDVKWNYTLESFINSLAVNF